MGTVLLVGKRFSSVPSDVLFQRPVYTLRPRKVYIVLIVTGHLMSRMGSRSILPVRLPVAIGTIIKLDGDGDEVGDGFEMCKQAFNLYNFCI